MFNSVPLPPSVERRILGLRAALLMLPPTLTTLYTLGKNQAHCTANTTVPPLILNTYQRCVGPLPATTTPEMPLYKKARIVGAPHAQGHHFNLG